MASHVDGPRRRRGVTYLSALILAVGLAVPVGAQESLDVVMRIGEVETNASDRPLEDVTIQSAKVITTPAG